jgi:hypothetical protein
MVPRGREQRDRDLRAGRRHFPAHAPYQVWLSPTGEHGADEATRGACIVSGKFGDSLRDCGLRHETCETRVLIDADEAAHAQPQLTSSVQDGVGSHRVADEDNLA